MLAHVKIYLIHTVLDYIYVIHKIIFILIIQMPFSFLFLDQISLNILRDKVPSLLFLFLYLERAGKKERKKLFPSQLKNQNNKKKKLKRS